MRLEAAIELATAAHHGQTQRDGTPFIEHPLRVMRAARTDDERIVGILHDVVERSEWTIDALKVAGLRHDLAEAVDALTRREGEVDSDLVRRAASNPLARRVKILDLEDKANIGRGRETIEEHSVRLARYLGSLLELRK